MLRLDLNNKVFVVINDINDIDGTADIYNCLSSLMQSAIIRECLGKIKI